MLFNFYGEKSKYSELLLKNPETRSLLASKRSSAVLDANTLIFKGSVRKKDTTSLSNIFILIESLQNKMQTYMKHIQNKSDTGMFGSLLTIMNESDVRIGSSYMNIILGYVLLENYISEFFPGSQQEFYEYTLLYGIKHSLYDPPKNQITL